MRHMENFSGLDAFIAVARETSFTRAADHLGVPRSTVTRRVARLEASLGAVLLERDTRNVRLTDEGRLVLERGSAVSQQLERIAADLGEMCDEPVGTLRVATPTGLGREISIGFLGRMRERYPRLIVHQDQTDLPPHRLVDRYDVIIHTGPFRDSDWVVHKLGEAIRMLVAAPSYLEKYGWPTTVEELAEHELLCETGELDETPRWPLRQGRQVDIRPAFRSNDLDLLRLSAAGGYGIALLARGAIMPDLATGKLVPVLPELVGDEGNYYILTTPYLRDSPRVRAYVDGLQEYTQEMIAQFAAVLGARFGASDPPPASA